SLLADPPQGRFRDRVTEAVWRRMTEADPELVRAGASVLALPQNAGLATTLVWESADVIWTALGDSSTDVNWYSKRATLAGVISATVLYWLGDNSEGQADSRAFLERRIENVMRIEKAKASLKKLPGAEALARAAFGWIRAPRRRALPGKAR
ncbi:MAG: COQ9 family protein, partial [Paracoccus sp. (in: a-proteobacteria)]|nr:COQ9 family protein [Paracoccus sp. (in: a-proteobacteria)]